MLAKPVCDLNLSVRARKALQLLNIQSLGDLISHTEAELMGVKLAIFFHGRQPALVTINQN